jgi:hypothetical protein
MSQSPQTRYSPDGQAWLPIVTPPEEYRVADLCIERLCSRFLGAYTHSTQQARDYKHYDIVRSCLLLACECGGRSPESTTTALEECLAVVAHDTWDEHLPWRMAIECCRYNPAGRQGISELRVNLDHHNSRIRGWLVGLAWIVRNRIDQPSVRCTLMESIAKHIVGWEQAVGLLRALHRADESFWDEALAYKPTDFELQYAERLKLVQERGLPAFAVGLEETELRARRIIDGVALPVSASAPS